MNLIKTIVAALIQLVNDLAKISTKVVPEIGAATFKATLMINNTVSEAAKESMAEHAITMHALENKNPEVDWKAINKRLEY